MPMKRAAGWFFLSLIASAAIAASPPAQALPEKPRRPDAGRVAALTDVLRIRDQGADFYLRSPRAIGPAPGDGLVIIDEDQVLRFDAKGRLLKNFFRAGQGPGELRFPESFLFVGDELVIFQGAPAKLVRFDAQGVLVRDSRLDGRVSTLIGRLGDRCLIVSEGPPPFEKIRKEEGDFLEVDFSPAFVDAEGRIQPTGLAFPVKWFARRLKTAIIADYVTPFQCVLLGGGLAAVAHEREYRVKVVDLEKKTVVRTIGRAYASVRAEAPPPEPAGAPRRLLFPREFHNDIQKIFAVDGTIWAMTSTVDPRKGVLVDVFDPAGAYLDAFYLPMPRGVDLDGLARHPITIADGFLYTFETREEGTLEVVKLAIEDRKRS